MPLKILKITLVIFFTSLLPLGYVLPQNAFAVIVFLLFLIMLGSLIAYKIDQGRHPQKYIYTDEDKERIIKNEVEKQINYKNKGVIPSLGSIVTNSDLPEETAAEIRNETKERLKKLGHEPVNPRTSFWSFFLLIVPILLYLSYLLISASIKVYKYYF